MSKKDKKRIVELERQQSILLATMQVLRKDFNTLSLSIVHDKIEAARAANSFQAGTIPSEKEQAKTEQVSPILNEETRQNIVRFGRDWGKSFCFISSILEKDFAETEQEKPEQSQPENHRENLGEPVLNKPIKANQFKKGLPKTAPINRISPEEREEDWESRKQISAEQLDASLSKLAELPLKSEQELAEENKPSPRKVALNKLVLFRLEAIEKLLSDDDLSIYNQCLYMQSQAAILQSELQDFRRKFSEGFDKELADFRSKVLDLGAVEPSKVEPKEAAQNEPKQAEEIELILPAIELIPPAPEEKEADKSGSELGGTWLIYDKTDKAWAAKCNEGGFYWSSKQDDFVLKFTSEAEAKQRYDALCSRGLISGMHRANSVVIRKEEAAQGCPELGGTDGADSPKSEHWAILFRSNYDQRRLGYLWKASGGTIQLKEFLCEAKRFNSHQKVLDYIEIYKDAFIKTSHIESQKIKYEIIQI